MSQRSLRVITERAASLVMPRLRHTFLTVIGDQSGWVLDYEAQQIVRVMQTLKRQAFQTERPWARQVSFFLSRERALREIARWRRRCRPDGFCVRCTDRLARVHIQCLRVCHPRARVLPLRFSREARDRMLKMRLHRLQIADALQQSEGRDLPLPLSVRRQPLPHLLTRPVHEQRHIVRRRIDLGTGHINRKRRRNQSTLIGLASTFRQHPGRAIATKLRRDVGQRRRRDVAHSRDRIRNVTFE